MALRLAGEEFNVQGVDNLGWLREINANDARPGLKIVNPSGDPIQIIEDSVKFFKFLRSPGSGNPKAYFFEYYGGIRFGSYASAGVHGKLYIIADTVTLESEDNRPVKISAGSSYVDVRSTIKNTGAANSGRVLIDDGLDLNWNELVQDTGVAVQAVKQVSYNSPSPVTIVSLPPYAEMIDVKVEIVTAFDGAGPSLIIGDSVDADGFMPAASINTGATGWYGDEADVKGALLWDSLNGHSIKPTYSSATDILCAIGGTGMTQGVANVYVTYKRLA